MLPVIFDVVSAVFSKEKTQPNESMNINKIFCIMTSSTFRQTVHSRIRQVIFLIPLFFLFACNKQCPQPFDVTNCLTADERKDLQQFLQFFLFNHYGAYVLFGSKPLCELSIHNMDSSAADELFKQFWERLSEEERAKVQEARRKAQAKHTPADLEKEMDLETSRYRGWLAFQKLVGRHKLKNFLFRVIPALRPDTYDICFLNIQQTSLILAENYEIFKAAAGMDFHPLQAVFEAEDPNSLFWINVMAKENHRAKGLLFGFGRKNSLFGHWAFSTNNLTMPNEKYRKEIETFLEQSTLSISTDLVPKGNASFHIPLFGSVSGDTTAEKYGQERAIIERKYRNKDMVEVTLNQLFH